MCYTYGLLSREFWNAENIGQMFEDVRYINVEKWTKSRKQLKYIYWNVYSECILILSSFISVNVTVDFATRRNVAYYSWINETKRYLIIIARKRNENQFRCICTFVVNITRKNFVSISHLKQLEYSKVNNIKNL